MNTFRLGMIWTCLLAVGQLPGAAIAGDTSSRVAVVDQHSAATLAFLTGLTGDQLARIGNGHVVYLADLPEDSRSQILNAAKTAYGSAGYEAAFGGDVVSSGFLLELLSDFSVTISGGAVESGHVITIPLAQYLPGIDPKPTDPAPAQTLDMPNPPTLESIMLAAPTDPVEHANYLRARALELLAPIGSYRLKRAGVPLSLSRFTSFEAAKLSELSDSERAWFATVYLQFCLRAMAVADRVQVSPASQRDVVVEGVPSEWLSKTPPLWSELGDVTVRFAVEYDPAIAPADKAACGRGGGWSLPKSGVQ